MATDPQLSSDATDHDGRRQASGWSGWSGWLVPGWVVLLSMLLLGPALAPGFVLTYDMVFVPRQDLLPASIGLGGGLPRAVPQDAVVAVLTTVIDGAWLQHAVLLAIPILAGMGTARLVRSAGRGAQLVAATLAIWNPFLVERLVQGHWALLLAYAATPWAIASAIRVRTTGAGATALIGWCALGALVPSGGILVVVVAVPLALIGGVADAKRKGALAVSAIAVNLPWILPALLHPDEGSADAAGASVFALRSEGPWGAAVTALGGGGLWNADAVPASRETPISLVLTVLVFAAAIAGWPSLRRMLGRAVAGWWTAIAILGWAMAVASALAPTVWADVITSVPGAGLARDSHKLLAPLVLLIAVTAALGLRRGWQRVSDVTARRSLIVAGVLIPIALLPDAALGVGGRLSAVDYPAQWHQMRQFFADQQESGDVVVLPWSTFRVFDFNAGRTVLDPAPRWLPRTSIAADALPVSRGGGIVVVPGDDPRSGVLGRTLDDGRPLSEVMPELGARWVLVESAQRPEPEPQALAGLEPVWQEGDLAVWELPVATPVDAQPLPSGAWLVIVVDLLVLLGLAMIIVTRLVMVGAGMTRIGSSKRRRRR